MTAFDELIADMAQGRAWSLMSDSSAVRALLDRVYDERYHSARHHREAYQLRAAILITRQAPRTTLGRNAREVLQSSGLAVLETELGYRVAYQEAPAAGLGVTAYEPEGKAAREILDLLHELETFMNPTEICHVA